MIHHVKAAVTHRFVGPLVVVAGLLAAVHDKLPQIASYLSSQKNNFVQTVETSAAGLWQKAESLRR